MIENSKPTFVEVLPGVIPKAIYKLSQNTQIPIIAGGMIESKEEVIEALGAGAVAISTSNSNLFSLL